MSWGAGGEVLDALADSGHFMLCSCCQAAAACTGQASTPCRSSATPVAARLRLLPKAGAGQQEVQLSWPQQAILTLAPAPAAGSDQQVPCDQWRGLLGEVSPAAGVVMDRPGSAVTSATTPHTWHQCHFPHASHTAADAATPCWGVHGAFQTPSHVTRVLAALLPNAPCLLPRAQPAAVQAAHAAQHRLAAAAVRSAGLQRRQHSCVAAAAVGSVPAAVAAACLPGQPHGQLHMVRPWSTAMGCKHGEGQGCCCKQAGVKPFAGCGTASMCACMLRV